MTEKALMKELSKYPTIEEIEKEYKEWAVNLLKVRFDLKPEAFDPHHAINYSFENCADGLWNNIKGSIEECLWLQKERIRLENQLSEMEEQRDRQAYIAEDLIQEKHKWTEQARKITATECYALVDEKCDPEIDIFDGRLYHVGYQAALQDIKKCLEERFGEEIKK